MPFWQTDVEIPHIPCAYPLGMENRKIPDSAIVASSRYSTYYGPERGRLNNQGNAIFFFKNLDRAAALTRISQVPVEHYVFYHMPSFFRLILY